MNINQGRSNSGAGAQPVAPSQAARWKAGRRRGRLVAQPGRNALVPCTRCEPSMSISGRCLVVATDHTRIAPVWSLVPVVRSGRWRWRSAADDLEVRPGFSQLGQSLFRNGSLLDIDVFQALPLGQLGQSGIVNPVAPLQSEFLDFLQHGEGSQLIRSNRRKSKIERAEIFELSHRLQRFFGDAQSASSAARSVRRRGPRAAQVEKSERRQHFQHDQPSVTKAAAPDGELLEIDERDQVLETDIGDLGVGNVESLEPVRWLTISSVPSEILVPRTSRRFRFFHPLIAVMPWSVIHSE